MINGPATTRSRSRRRWLTAYGLRLARGELLRIIYVEGGQTGDLMAFSMDGRERLSNGRTFDYGGKISAAVSHARGGGIWLESCVAFASCNC